jgi:hypothetical protein
MLLSLAIWLQNTPLFVFIREAVYGYPTALAFHLVFISVSAAMIVTTDLRLLGWAFRSYSVSEIVNQLRIPKRIGFLFAAGCGFLIFGIKSEEYYYNAFFRVKLLLFLMVAVHALVFRRSVYNRAHELDSVNPPPTRAKLAAGISLFLWICIACVGRGIGYISAPLFSHHFASLW